MGHRYGATKSLLPLPPAPPCASHTPVAQPRGTPPPVPLWALYHARQPHRRMGRHQVPVVAGARGPVSGSTPRRVAGLLPCRAVSARARAQRRMESLRLLEANLVWAWQQT